MDSQKKRQSQNAQKLLFLTRRGLSFSQPILARLHSAGISCDATLRVVTAESGQPAVAIHGRESGGSVAEIGHYVGFCKTDGSPLGWLYPIKNFMPNGPHAVVVAEELVRLDMYRFETSYDLLITHHYLKRLEQGGKPKLWNDLIFYARFGTLERELWGKDKMFRGGIAPQFFQANGQPAAFPERFRQAAFKITEGVTCTKCRHCHLLEPPTALEPAAPDLAKADVAAATASGSGHAAQQHQ